jgi:hypothetical protein
LSNFRAREDSPKPGATSPFSVPLASVPSEGPPEEILPAENPPDWLKNLKSAAAFPEEAAPEMGDTTPSWLGNLKSTPIVEEGSSAASEEEVPDWLASLPAIPMPTHTEEPSATPEWLGKLKGMEQEPVSPPAGQDAGAVSPDWLSSVGVEPGAPASSVFTDEPFPGTASSTSVPDWLSQLKTDVSAASQAETGVEEFEKAVEPLPAEKTGENIPSWLAGVNQGTSPAEGTPALVMSDTDAARGDLGSTAFSLETPDWLSRLRPERPESESETTVSTPGEPGAENLEAAELPSWIQAMRPLEAVVSDSAAAEMDESAAPEASGPLAGLRGVLPSSPTPGTMRKPPAYALKLQVNANQQRYATQLEKMIVEEGQARGIKPERKISNRIWRLLIAGILLIAVLLPLVSGQTLTPDMESFPSEWEATNPLLDQLRSDAPLLVVFDYDPALSGELEAAAAPVIDHILYRGNHLALISTAPTGPALAEQFLTSTQKYHLDTGLMYTNLGYLAGGPAGIQLFASDPVSAVTLDMDGEPAWGTPALQGVTRLSDFAALILLTDNADTGRIWIEQTGAAIGETPFLMIISAQAEPMIRPYFDSGQIQGLVSGLVGGKVYEQNYGTPGLARRYWDSFGLGTLAAEILIVIGSIWGVFTVWRSRRKA